MHQILGNGFSAIVLAACLISGATALPTDSSGISRRLMQASSLPVLVEPLIPSAPAPAPGSSGPPCSCSIASIFSGVTYCFALTPAAGTNGSLAQTASPSCKVFTQAYSCSGKIVTLAPGTKTSDYPNATLTGQGLQCNIIDWGNSPIPAPAAPPASAGASPCITLPAGDYGPTGSIEYAIGPNGVPTPNCVSGSGTVCSVYIPISNGTAKICASQTAEDNLQG